MAYERLLTSDNLLLILTFGLCSAIAVFLLTLPTQYDPLGRLKSQGPGPGETSEEERFRNVMDRRADVNVQAGEKSVQVVVLGDIGRSPRMQYHAISFAEHGSHVELIGYLDSELHPDVQHRGKIKLLPLVPIPSAFQTSNKALFLLLGPLKVLWQFWTLYQTLAYRATASRYILVQNPPSIPCLVVCVWVAFFRNSRLVIDWHNFGYSLLALKLGEAHPLVHISRWYEGFFAKQAWAHLAVTDAMVAVLRDGFGVQARALHDRPAAQFRPLPSERREQWLTHHAETREFAQDLLAGRWRLVVSSTSWTPDEDFSILLDALQDYSARVDAASGTGLPKLLAIVTGKGPQRQYFLDRIAELNQQKKLQNVIAVASWLSTEDYAALLGAADVGVSLHTSSSGVDLPMKVVDMFGTGLPVVAASFRALPELVKDGVNGRSFADSSELAGLLGELLGGDGEQLSRLREGAMQECTRRWDDEWDPIAGKLFHLAD